MRMRRMKYAVHNKMEQLERYEREIRALVSGGWTHADISGFFRILTGRNHGLSVRTIGRFCARRDIHHRCGVNALDLDRLVCNLVYRVGHAYGRRTLHGLLQSRGVCVSQRRVATSMQRVAPLEYAGRRHTTRRLLNPVPYHAHHFGEKLHLDQNEKVAMFGATHVLAVDGYSRKIVGFVTIPKKNSVVVYDLLFRPLLLSQGLWEQVRVDHGTEFTLVAAAQNHLSHLRHVHHRQPVFQSLSRHNHRAERIWPEINQRINYPIKRVLVEMENREEVNMADEVSKFCVSWVTISVMASAVYTFIEAWNSHCIPGPNGGVPNVLATRTNAAVRLMPESVPTTSQILQIYEVTRGGRSYIRPDASVGLDPLQNHAQLQEIRLQDFSQMFPDMSIVFQDVLHGNGLLLCNSIKAFIHITNRLATLL